MPSVPSMSSKSTLQSSSYNVPIINNDALRSQLASMRGGSDYNTEQLNNEPQAINSTVPNFHEDKILKKTPLRKGAFGECFKTKHSILGTVVLKLPTNVKDFQLIQRREFAVAFMLNHHPHIVSFFGYVYDTDPTNPKGFLMEYMENGSLRDYIYMNSNLDKRLCNTWAKQIAQAMAFMHERHVMHRDLNPNNILVSRNTKVVKISDFGYSKHEDTNNYNHTTNVGTGGYQAPEIIMHRKYCFAVDVYSYAMTLYYIYYRKDPISTDEQKKYSSYLLYTKLTDEQCPLRPEIEQDTMDLLIQQCWKTNPKDRPEFTQIVDIFNLPEAQYLYLEED